MRRRVRGGKVMGRLYENYWEVMGDDVQIIGR